MSDHTITALPAAEFRGFVTIREAGLQGMITLRGDLSDKVIAEAVRQVTGCPLPTQRRVTRQGDCAVAWMSPDEVLVLCAYQDAPDIAAKLADAVVRIFATVADVSDARAVFAVDGPGWRDVLAKLCPVDFATFREGDMRRTRAAQVAAAIWVSGADQAMVVCFRSVAEYMFDLLSNAATPGSEPHLYI